MFSYPNWLFSWIYILCWCISYKPYLQAATVHKLRLNSSSEQVTLILLFSTTWFSFGMKVDLTCFQTNWKKRQLMLNHFPLLWSCWRWLYRLSRILMQTKDAQSQSFNWDYIISRPMLRLGCRRITELMKNNLSSYKS